MDSSDTESQADSATLKVAKHDFATIKINVTRKALSPTLAPLVVRSFGFKVAVVPPPKRSKRGISEVSPLIAKKEKAVALFFFGLRGTEGG